MVAALGARATLEERTSQHTEYRVWDIAETSDDTRT